MPAAATSTLSAMSASSTPWPGAGAVNTLAERLACRSSTGSRKASMRFEPEHHRHAHEAGEDRRPRQHLERQAHAVGASWR